LALLDSIQLKLQTDHLIP